MEKKDLILAGKIAKEVVDFIKPKIKKGKKLLEIANEIENKIIELGGKIAFPTNLSINEIAAHYTPSYNDESVAHGLLKVDLGVQINGAISDTAFSLDLEDDEENKKLILASENALNKALEKISVGVTVCEIGETVENEIKKEGFQPIVNLTGHSIDEMDLHSGISIPNYNNLDKTEIEEGLFAIEPFVTNGVGRVHDSSKGNIFVLIDTKNPRSQNAREVLEYIVDNFESLPFASRWVVKKLGAKALLGLRELEQIGNLHQFFQLVEDSKGKVAQSEHSVLIEGKEKIIITK